MTIGMARAIDWKLSTVCCRVRGIVQLLAERCRVVVDPQYFVKQKEVWVHGRELTRRAGAVGGQWKHAARRDCWK